MKITIESTTKIVSLNGVPARIWEGRTEHGIAVHCYVTRIATDAKAQADLLHFEQELQEHAVPTPTIQSIPLRLIL